MPANVFKDTAGRTLVGFAVLVLGVTVATVQNWWARTDLEWAEFPTAVEDMSVFVPPPSVDGQPQRAALVFWGAPEGIPQRGTKPLVLRDFRMRKLIDPRFEDGRQFTRFQGQEHFVYWYDKDEISPETGFPPRFFLKTGRDRYLAFARPSPGAPVGADSDLRPPADPVTPSGHQGS